MNRLLRPANPLTTKKYIAQIFVVNDQGQMSIGGTFPKPEDEKDANGAVRKVFKGTTLLNIKSKLEPIINAMLQEALAKDESKILLRITEIYKFNREIMANATQQFFNQMRAQQAREQAQSATPKTDEKGVTENVTE